jgi:Trypsin-co-occurring domain 2
MGSGEVMADQQGAGLGLAAAVRGLRAELTAAMTAGEGERVRFELGPVRMEFSVELTDERGVDAGVKFWVITAGGKGSRSSGSTHTVTVELTPKGADGGPLGLIGDRDTDRAVPGPSAADSGGGTMGDRE